MPSAPRVVLVLPTLVGGGAERIVVEVAEGLAREGGVDVEVVTLLDDPSMSRRTAAGVEIRCLGRRRVRNALLPLVVELRRDPPVAVLTTLRHLSIGLGLVDRALRPETRHVIRVASTYSADLAPLGWFRSAVVRELVRRTHRRASDVVCVSEGVRDDLVTAFGLDTRRCRVVPNPVDVDDLRRRASAPIVEAPARRAAVRFLTAGRLRAEKDHATLLDAFSRIAEDLDAELVVAGDGGLRSQLEELAGRLAIGDRVSFVGYVPNPYPLFASSDVFVLSSRREGLPNVLLEALALGLPCVSTDCPSGPAEILVAPELGVLVPVGDPGRLAEAMRDVAGRPAGGTAGPDHVRRHHSPAVALSGYRAALLGTRRTDRSGAA